MLLLLHRSDETPRRLFFTALETAMISVLAQERLLGAALGSVAAGIAIFEHRRSIYKSISAAQHPPRGAIFGRSSRLEFARAWNKSVDNTLGPIIKSLSSTGW